MRRDLSKSQQIVQACHAVAENMMLGMHHPWDNGTMVLLGVKDEKSLVREVEAMDHWEGIFFAEEDLNDEYTAFAVVGDDDLGDLLKHLRLL